MNGWQLVAFQTELHTLSRGRQQSPSYEPCVRFNWPNNLPHCLHFPPVAIFMPHAFDVDGVTGVMQRGV